tara:strand:+ start:2758 stop:2976 length:219 start_codon:yes stop_codon:yes gene_type:complete
MEAEIIKEVIENKLQELEMIADSGWREDQKGEKLLAHLRHGDLMRLKMEITKQLKKEGYYYEIFSSHGDSRT